MYPLTQLLLWPFSRRKSGRSTESVRQLLGWPFSRRKSGEEAYLLIYQAELNLRSAEEEGLLLLQNTRWSRPPSPHYKLWSAKPSRISEQRLYSVVEYKSGWWGKPQIPIKQGQCLTKLACQRMLKRFLLYSIGQQTVSAHDGWVAATSEKHVRATEDMVIRSTLGTCNMSVMCVTQD